MLLVRVGIQANIMKNMALGTEIMYSWLGKWNCMAVMYRD
jgi:hypothetical protein